MDVQVKTKNLQLTDELQDYIDSRLQKLDRIDHPVIDAKFEIRTERNRTGPEMTVAQFTIVTKNNILRTEEKNRDLHVAIDAAVDRMERQIRRLRNKQVFGRRRQRMLEAEESASPVAADQVFSPDLIAPDGTDELDVDSLVRRKRFKIQPVSEAEAIEQMELLGHDFYVFFNPDVAQINVLYRRRDGRYGIIQPDLA